jgi:transposase-like protein
MQRNRISKADKQRLIACSENGGDFVTLANHLGIKETSARTIIRRHIKNLHQGRHGGHKPRVMTGEVGQSLVEFVEKNPLATLETMRGFLSSACGVNVSVSTIAGYLDGHLITIKQVRDVLAARNSPPTKERRFHYAKWFIENQMRDKCVYIDESGFNIWTRRNYGRSKKGDRCFRVCDGQRGQNISLCMAIGITGVLHYKLVVGSFDSQKYCEFLTELSEILSGGEFAFVMDNCSIHGNADLDREEHTAVFLPPYSPFLNPIEAAFSALKAAIKERLNAIGAGIGYTLPQRRAVLQTIIAGAVDVINGSKCRAFFNHSSTFLAKCIQREDILGD